MDINSKEFEEKFKDLIEKGYCKECIAQMISPYPKTKMCKKCEKIFMEDYKLWT